LARRGTGVLTPEPAPLSTPGQRDDPAQGWITNWESLSGELLHDQADHALVENQQRGVDVGLQQTHHTLAHAGAKLLPALTAGVGKPIGTGLPVLAEDRIAGLDLLHGETLPAPEIDLPKVALEANRRTAARDPGRPPGAAKGARNHQIDRLATHLAARSCHLLPSFGAQVDIRAPVEANAGLAIGLTVTNQQDATKLRHRFSGQCRKSSKISNPMPVVNPESRVW